MAYLTFEDSRRALRERYPTHASKDLAAQLLRKAARAHPEQTFDIFLSHSIQDAELIAGVKAFLEADGWSVYVDWIDDAQLDRTRVTAATAELLRNRMQSCNSLLFATSEASPSSRWMPWELGYFDGMRRGRVAILPLVPTSSSPGFVGQEYLSLYPKLEKLPSRLGSARPYITKGVGSRQYMPLRDFQGGGTEFRSY